MGRAVLRRATREDWPCKFIVYSRDETKQWELKRRYPNVFCVLGDVARDVERLMAVMAGVDTVLHLAAVKYIPEAEHNVFETVDVNINGSRNVAMAAIGAGVKTVVGISTDKACGPLNVYGMTKGVMERMFSEANRMGRTNFVNVRYGNVIGSTGSVIPIFKKQLEDYNEIRVTDSKMTRFWLSADDAIDLIIKAHDNAEELASHTFISACPSMRIVDLAEAVWLTCNRNGDTPIVFTGIRPGEKMHEALFNEQEAPRTRDFDNGFVMSPATSVGKMPNRMAYSSDQPRRWLSVQDMILFIGDAQGI